MTSRVILPTQIPKPETSPPGWLAGWLPRVAPTSNQYKVTDIEIQSYD